MTEKMIDLGRKRGEKVAEARAVLDKAEKEKRPPTAEERGAFDKLMAESDALRLDEAEAELAQSRGRKTPLEIAGQRNASPLAEFAWEDKKTGREIRALNSTERLADLTPEANGVKASELSLGRWLRAGITGDWTGAEAERRALSTGPAYGGSILVPDALAATVLDKARALAVSGRIGQVTIPMSAGTLMFGRVATDAGVTSKAENATWTEDTGLTFDAITLEAKTLGTLMYASREWMQDAPNAAAVLEMALTRRMADKLDYYTFRGTGAGNEPTGIDAMSGVQTVAVGGAFASYDKWLDGLALLWDANADVNFWATNGHNAIDLAKIVTGIASDLTKLAVPKELQAIPFYKSSQFATGTGYAGDGRQLIVGIRGGIEVQLSKEGSTLMSKYQTAILCACRADTFAYRPEHLCTLTGIT